jgi:hypothetical protein
MWLLKYLFSGVLIFTGLLAFSQSNEAVILRWKLKPGEVITYKTIMQQTDSTAPSVKFNGGIWKDTAMNNNLKKTLTQLNKAMQGDSLKTYLKLNNKDLITVEMHMSAPKQAVYSDTIFSGNDMHKFMALMNKMNAGIMLSGTIHEDGSIASFYTNSSQKNIIEMLFKLPEKAVKVGDTWPLDINYISMDQNFVCDSSYKKNEVIVVAYINKDGDKIVTLKYNILEYVHGSFSTPFDNKPVQTSMEMGYLGTANFSVEKGRWLNYEGIMKVISTGIVSVEENKRFELVAE